METGCAGRMFYMDETKVQCEEYAQGHTPDLSRQVEPPSSWLANVRVTRTSLLTPVAITVLYQKWARK